MDHMNELLPIHAAFADWAARAPERPVMHGPGAGTFTCADLAMEEAVLCGKQRDLGIGRVDRVAFTAGPDARRAALVLAFRARRSPRRCGPRR